MSTFRIRCTNCGAEFEISEDDLDVDYDIERFDGKSVELIITVTVRCIKCGRRVLYGAETVTIPIKTRGGEIVERREE